MERAESGGLLYALKQLVGLAPRDLREVWHEKPLVIVTESDSLFFSGRATIEYTPGAEQYECGHANVFDEATGDQILSAEIVRQRVYSAIDQSNPWRVRWSRLGITAKAVDAEGRNFTLFIGRHAQTYLLRKAGSPLDYTMDTATIPFPGDEELDSEA